MLKFSFDKSLVPPGYFVAIMPDGTPIKQAGREIWFQEIKNHYRRNGLVLPDNWKAYYEDRLCKLLPPGFCVNEAGMPMNSEMLKVDLPDLRRGMTVLWSITRDPDPLVDKETAVKRAAICAACPANLAVSGCHSCEQFSNLVLDIKGKQTTPADPYLRVCGFCKCYNQAQVWVKKEHLAKGVDGVMLRQMAEMNPECWKAKELQES
jgi:hypothetical protein